MYLLDLITQLKGSEANTYNKADIDQPCLTEFFIGKYLVR